MLTVYPLNCGKHQVLDLDADEYGNFIFLLSNREVWTNAGQVPLHQEFRTAFIREVDVTRFLVVEDRQGAGSNGYIFDTTGHLLLTFDAGGYIADVLVQAGQIVVSYFDQAFGNSKPSGDGIAVFGLDGKQLFGVNSSGAASIMDCYCMCKPGKDRILAYTYTEFRLLELCLTDYRIVAQPTPADFRGSHALTTNRGDVVFHGSYDDNTSFFWWNRKNEVSRFGHFPTAGLRGNGKFLTFDANSFMIIDAMQAMSEV